MKDWLRTLTEQYGAALGEYLLDAAEPALKKAYELGRQAVAEGSGVLEMAAIYQRTLLAALLASRHPEEAPVIIERATAFFAESVSSFEMALRAFQSTHQALEAERQRYHEQFEFAPDAYLVTERDGTIREANQAAARLLRVSQNQLIGKPLLEFVSAGHCISFYEQLDRLASGEADHFEDWQVEIAPPEAAAFPGAFTVGTIRSAEGELAGIRWLLRDISERRRIERERAELLVREQVAHTEAEAARRLAFLAEASTLLAASLDYEATLASVARRAVPYLGDWCFVHVVEDNGAVRCLVTAHSDAFQYPEADHQERDLFLPNPNSTDGIARVIHSGKPEIVAGITDPWIISIAANGAQLALFRRLGFRSALAAPMIARGRIVGTVTFVVAESGRRYTAVDMALCEDLARRCAFATDNARLYRQVIIEKDRAEKSSRAKDEFLAVLSHELRNPLMPIMGWVRILKNQATIMRNNVLKEGIHAVERNAHNIHRLVEDCLDLARISEKRIRLEVETVDLNEIATASVGSVAEMARNKGLRINLDLSPSSLWVSADRSRLEQVLMNLLTNAIRYTPHGGSVTIQSRQTGAEGEVVVKDTGVGIAPEFLELIFEPFRRGTDSWLSAESGLGLGLSIACQIVQMHGGRIRAASDGLGQGSTFAFSVPLSSQKEAPVEPKPEQHRVPPGEIFRVLLIEDAEDILFLMQVELEWLGYSVLAARDGNAGFEIAEREKPDAIISDIKMPGLDGYSLIAKIRQHPELRSTPAIALTGFGMKSDIQRAIADGYDAHLIKPADINELSALLQRLVRRKGFTGLAS